MSKVEKSLHKDSPSNIPVHVAIIMDGNGRWAQKRKLPRLFGHKEGAKTVERVLEIAIKRGIRYLTLYAFSTENWKRPKEEVEGLFSLLKNYLTKKSGDLQQNDIRLRFAGRIESLPEDVRMAMVKVQKETSNCKTLDLILCINYGGRQEIIDAARKLLDIYSSNIDEIDEVSFRSCLYLPDVPDPDLIIRTSGEMRLSNFLLWQSSYSELFFTETLWPDFSEKDFDEALESYAKRQRRYGAV
ncbi:undecaprenyl diphosphate synthase [Thermovirga lienii DSM 17291]|uniref:Isoprenyl transferase n=1 Tax=Thermovirga lienii (strain ATCC BAA-1197 / DSM 17291 / Cas60314) TaxID=580340 RepID=G7VA84_THELD|nr:undecaprenyl diphosphate synthase [Thermovirga lienii DSM 17291]MDN5318266.1 undecaprenyl diphosphate synthase [Thermovirga sp.]MDN5367408.1 undecaprenyl diphosphate synthase [Thermovirga sp.]